MKLKCVSNQLKVEDPGSFLKNKYIDRTVSNLTVGKVYTVTHTAAMTGITTNCVHFFNDNNEWQSIRHDKALTLFVPVD